jgi:hypothetical protein
LRWISRQLLAPIPWAQRVWDLPFLSALAPSERDHQRRGKRHQTIADRGRQMVRQRRRWLPERALVLVADSMDAVLDLLDRWRRLARPDSIITRRRLEAALDDPAPPQTAATKGRPRLGDPQTVWETLTVRWYGGLRRTIEVATATAVWYHTGLPPVPSRWALIRAPDGHFEPPALLRTDLDVTAAQIVAWSGLRWQLAVTFHEVRAHLGVETQRQWSDRAILRTTPALFARFSLVTLFAHHREQPTPSIRQAAGYHQSWPTFADALAVVRQDRWPVALFAPSPTAPDIVQIPRALFERLTDTLAFAA